jgi:hypothetical protein
MFVQHFSSSGPTNFRKWIFKYTKYSEVLRLGADVRQETMMFLQALPTQDWCEKEMEILLSEAYALPAPIANSWVYR